MQTVKLVVLGDKASHKSSVTVQYTHAVTPKEYDPTIEDSYWKEVIVEGIPFRVELLDTAGTENNIAMRDLYMKNADGILLLYSITSRATFEALPEYVEQTLRVKDVDEVPTVVAGNCCEQEDKRAVTKEEGQKLAAQWNAGFFEISSRTNKESVDEVFAELLRRVATSKQAALHKQGGKEGAKRCIVC
ncbi:Ras- protein rsr1 [Balamuthia mandrillaris]